MKRVRQEMPKERDINVFISSNTNPEYAARKKKDFIQENNIDLLHCDDIYSAVGVHEVDIPVITTIHDILPHFHCTDWEKGELSNWRTVRKICEGSDKVLVPSELTKKEIKTYYPKTDVKVTHLGVDEKFREMDYDTNENLAGYVGSFYPRKGIDALLDIWKKYEDKYDNGRLEINGKIMDEPYGFYRNLEKSNNLDNVSFPGFVDEDKLVEKYNEMDCFVFGSQHEGFGLMILEAQACGVPVIIRENSGLPDAVTRYAYEASGDEEFADLIESAFNDELETRTPKAYAQRFTWQDTAEKTIEAYKDVV